MFQETLGLTLWICWICSSVLWITWVLLSGLHWVADKRALQPRRVNLSTMWHHLEKNKSGQPHAEITLQANITNPTHGLLTHHISVIHHKSGVGPESVLGITMQRKTERRLIIDRQNYRHTSPTDWGLRQICGGGGAWRGERREYKKRTIAYM